MKLNLKRKLGFVILTSLITSIPLSGSSGVVADPVITTPPSRVETFEFPTKGTTRRGKIFLPASFETDKNLPAIFLIDFTDQHFRLITDEFKTVVHTVQQINGLEALVVSLEIIPDIDAEPDTFDDHFEVFKDLASYVDGRYTSNSSRTLIGRGSESGMVLMSLFQQDSGPWGFDNFIATDPSGLYILAVMEVLKKEIFNTGESPKKLHFSFSTSNDREKCTELIHLIRKAKYPWLEFESVEYTDRNYENTYPISFAAGVEFIFNK